MKKIGLLFISVLFVFSFSIAQLTTPPDGGNKLASVSERVGITDVTIQYNRPGVKGREGKIWGQLVPYGYTDQGFGTSKSAPWRAGANECTTISFANDVKVEGKDLAAGKYALFLALQPGEAEVIFNRNARSWGSFFYEPSDDVLKVKVKTQQLNESVEWLKYEFTDQTENSASIAMMWEKLKIPFKVEVDLVQTQLASFRKELTSDIGFRTDPWVQAARYCVQKKTNLEEGLKWAEYALNAPFIGQKNFTTLSTKAEVLEALNKKQEAEALMKEALPMGNVNEVHQYARRLLGLGKKTEAFEVFQANAKKYPNVFTTNVGMARAYSGTGDYKSALKYAKAALPQAPDKVNKVNVERIIAKLEKGEDINQ